MGALFDALKNMDIAKLLPEMDAYLRALAGWLRVFLLAGPVMLLILGAIYRWAPDSQTAQKWGYISKESLKSGDAWARAQRLAAGNYLKFGGLATGAVLAVSLFFGVLGPVGMTVVSLVLALAQGVGICLLRKHINEKIKKG